MVESGAFLPHPATETTMPDKTLRVLSIGNSFSASVCRQLPPMAAAEGRALGYACLFIGGCPLRLHAENLGKSAADPSFRLYRADDDRLRPGGAWGFGQAGMFERLSDAYDRFAADEGVARQIPTGVAVQLTRVREKAPFVPYETADLARYRWPDLPPQAGDVVGRLGWRRNWDTGEMEIGRDTIHLNERGEYLQALVWFGFLFGADPTAVSYVSPHVGDADARFLRECARDALVQGGAL